jgi:hypothetical protein
LHNERSDSLARIKGSFDSEFDMETPAEFSDKSPAAIHDYTVLRTIAEGVEAETGDRFFSSLARNLALALEVQYASSAIFQTTARISRPWRCGSAIISAPTSSFV